MNITKIKDNEYKCENCHQTFKKGWSDEEALQEFENEYTVKPDKITGGSVVVCDDCYHEIMNFVKRGETK